MVVVVLGRGLTAIPLHRHVIKISEISRKIQKAPSRSGEKPTWCMLAIHRRHTHRSNAGRPAKSL